MRSPSPIVSPARPTLPDLLPAPPDPARPPAPRSDRLPRARRYGHLVQTEWDRNFLNTAHFAKWFDAQQNEQPIQPGVLLVNYVRERIDAQNKAKAAHQQAQQAVADAHAQAQPQSQAQAGQVSQAQSNSNGGLFGGGGQNNGQPAPYLSTASHIYPNEGMGTVNPAALSGQASPATNGSVSTAPLKQQQVKKEAVKPTSRESTPAPTSAPNKSKLEPVPTLEWDAIQPSLTAAIRDDKLIKTPTVAANYLAKTISAFNIAAGRLTPWGDTSYVPPTGRIEVLKQLNRRAGLEFFQAWLRPDAAAGMEVFAGWLTGSVQTLKKEEVPENETKKDKAVREHKRARAKELEPVLGPLMVVSPVFFDLAAWSSALGALYTLVRSQYCPGCDLFAFGLKRMQLERDGWFGWCCEPRRSWALSGRCVASAGLARATPDATAGRPGPARSGAPLAADTAAHYGQQTRLEGKERALTMSLPLFSMPPR